MVASILALTALLAGPRSLWISTLRSRLGQRGPLQYCNSLRRGGQSGGAWEAFFRLNGPKIVIDFRCDCCGNSGPFLPTRSGR